MAAPRNPDSGTTSTAAAPVTDTDEEEQHPPATGSPTCIDAAAVAARPALVRSNSVNVASVARGIGVRSVNLEDCWDDDESDAMVRSDGHRRRRRRSLNVASLLRGGLARRNLTDGKEGGRSGGGAAAAPATLATLAIREYDTYILGDDLDLDDGDSSSGLKVVEIRRRPVTFGAYRDDHNDEMIPELVRAPGSISRPRVGSDDDDTIFDDDGSGGNGEKRKRLGNSSDSWTRRVQKLVAESGWPVQASATVAACLLTYAVSNRSPPDLDAQIAAMVLVTLVGATVPHLIAAAACGVYAGSVGPDTVGGAVGGASAYGWVLLLGVLAAAVWQLVSRFGIMPGFSGRLGASAFVATNVTALLAIAADPGVSFDRYGSLRNARDGAPSPEEAASSLLACVFLASSGGWFRLVSTVPVNPVLVPSAWALFCMLVASITEYRCTASVLQGFAVGSYAAMASEARVPTLPRFAAVGFFAGFWNILLQPFFLGFGGKAGFTAMLGYSTYRLLRKIYKKQLKRPIKKLLARMRGRKPCNGMLIPSTIHDS